MSKRTANWHRPVIYLVVALWLGSLIGVVGCSQETKGAETPKEQAGISDSGQAALGDPRRGASLIVEIGCASCHTVPGVQPANGVVGTPLNWWSDRMYTAGRLLNSPNNAIAWILAPQAVEPGTAMPDMNLDSAQARDIAAYLYRLRRGEDR